MTSTTLNRNRFKFYGLFLFYYLALGGYYPYYALYLQNTLGFTSQQVALVVSLTPIIGMIFIPLWGLLTDLSRKPKLILNIALVGTIVFIFLYGNVALFIPLLIFASIMNIFQRAIQPLLDNLALAYSKDGSAKYSVIRSFGSLGFMLGSVLIGLIISFTMPNIFFYTYIISLILVSIFLYFIPNVKFDTHQKVHLKQELPKLLKNKKYVKLLLINCLIIGVADSAFTYNGLVIETMTTSVAIVGFIGAIMVLPEFFIMQKVDDLNHRFGYKKILLVSVIFLLIRLFVSSFTDNFLIYIIVTSFHAITIALTIPSILQYVRDTIPTNLSATAFTTLSLVASGVTSLIMYISGMLIEPFGIKSIFIFYAIIAVLAYMIIVSIEE